MTTPQTAPPAPTNAASEPQPVPPRTLEWLTREMSAWRRDGLISSDQEQGILHRYQASRRFSLASLVLTLGAAFVGIGLIWLVAANLDRLAPTARFGAVAAIWIGLTVIAEALAGRAQGGSVPSPVVGAVRILAALAFGATVFQAAQSLQVPAYEPKLLGVWALGALTYAYLVRASGPLLIGLSAGVGWLLWQTAWEDPSPLGVVLALAAASVGTIAVAAVHERWNPSFSQPWRELGAGLMLVTLFGAAIPEVTTEEFVWTGFLVGAVVIAGLLAAAGIAFGCGRARLEPAAALVAAALALLLVWWDTGSDTSDIDLADWAQAAVAIGVYVGAAAGVAALGVLRDSWRLTALAMLALVVFTTFQSFAVFSAILPGAWLFVALGLVFLTTGYLFDRARRRLAHELSSADGSTS